MKKTYRGLTLAAAFLLLFAILFSELFIICESDHDCSGSECLICAGITFCENFLHQMILSVVASAFFGAVMHCFFCGIFVIRNRIHVQTPVSLKVKLSN